MFLRRHRQHAAGETCEDWTLCESVRTAQGPRQKVVATLGKLTGGQPAEEAGWEQLEALREVQPGLEAKLLAHPDGRGHEPFVLCRSSSARRGKESAMLARQMEALSGQLAAVDTALQKQPQADIEKVSRRIGRWQGRHPAAASPKTSPRPDPKMECRKSPAAPPPIADDCAKLDH